MRNDVKTKFRLLGGKISEMFSPSEARCLGCDADVFDESGFCEDCIRQVPFNNGKTCKRCGVALHGEEDYCGNCAFEKNWFDRAYSPFSYDKVIRTAILSLKFGGHAYVSRVLAKYLVFIAERNNLRYDVVCYVPMTKISEKRRGYNQARLLAESFCDILEINGPVCALEKVKQTERQEMLDKKKRKENLVGAFRANASAKGKRVLLIDDIKTTGATLNECAKALKRAGATEVIGLTVASREEYFQMEAEVEI